jgi:hypothetical protein
MPVIGRRTRQNLDSIVIQCLANVFENIRLVSLQLGNLIRPLFGDFLVDVNNRSNHRPRIFVETSHMLSTAAIEPRDANAQLLVGTLGSRKSWRGGGKE